MTGAEPSDAAIDFAAEVAGLVLHTLGLGAFEREEAALLVDRLAKQTGLPWQRIAALPELGDVAGSISEISEFERRTFASYFGQERASLLQVGDARANLSDFAARYDDQSVLFLCELLCLVSHADDQTTGAELARLWAAAGQLGIDPTYFTTLLQRYMSLHYLGGQSFALRRRRQLIGRDSACDINLPHPSVAPVHAELVWTEGSWRIVSRHLRPTSVDGVIVASAPLSTGSVVEIGCYSLRIQETQIHISPVQPASALVVHQLRRKFGDRVILEDVSFTALTGELIALVGPSGSGKSTLLDAISGVSPADSGTVHFDGLPFHELLENDPSVVAQVPQDDVVLPELTVEESLQYAGWIRANSPGETRARVNRLLTELGIEHIRKSRVGNALRRGISGGQRKRVNLGQELMSPSTRVLFLDEPTSGLDPRAAREIVRLARRLADQGRVVFLVTHELGPGLVAQADHLLLLAPGGQLAWYGPPAQACAWMGVDNAEALFDRIGDRTPAAWASAYRASSEGRSFISLRAAGGSAANESRRKGTRLSPFAALLIVADRYMRVKSRDRVGLAVTLVQPLLLAGVMALVFQRPSTPLLFMLTLSALWFGMSGAVRELLSDRTQSLRERRVGVGVFPYLGGKVLVLSAITAAQCVALTGFVYSSGALATGGFSFLALAGVAVLTGWAGMSLGFLVSAAVSSTEAAIGILVLILIPQIAFSGILMPLGEMNPAAKVLSTVVVQRYSLDAALRSGETVQYLHRDEWQERPTAGDLYLLGLRPSGSPPTGYTRGVLAMILGSFASIYLAGAAWLLARRHR